LGIYDDPAFRIEGDASGGEVEAFNVGTATNSDEDDISFELERGKGRVDSRK